MKVITYIFLIFFFKNKIFLIKESLEVLIKENESLSNLLLDKSKEIDNMY